MVDKLPLQTAPASRPADEAPPLRKPAIPTMRTVIKGLWRYEEVETPPYDPFPQSAPSTAR